MMDTADSYKAHWATLTGRSEREIYVPLALREARSFEVHDFREGLGRSLVGWRSSRKMAEELVDSLGPGHDYRIVES